MVPNMYKTVKGRKDRVHRHIMAEHMGRPLDGDEHVYHLNGDSNDNRLENLVIVKKNVRRLTSGGECLTL